MISQKYYDGIEKGFRHPHEHFQTNKTPQAGENTAGVRQAVQKEQLHQNSAELTLLDVIVEIKWPVKLIQIIVEVVENLTIILTQIRRTDRLIL